jgi:phosphohistidine phosphatase
MKLYLVQHGEAKLKSEDPERPLTKTGKADVVRVAALARQAGVEVGQILHSDLLRARDTASILGDFLAPARGVTTMAGLRPRDDVGPVAEMLEHTARPLMLVGHRPFLERLAGLLLAGNEQRAVVSFHKGGLVCLTRSEIQSWSVEWIITPQLAF